MQIYLVGGAVRDALLNRKVVERDYVVVGATPEEMLSQGFTQVAKTSLFFYTLKHRKNTHLHVQNVSQEKVTPVLYAMRRARSR